MMACTQLEQESSFLKLLEQTVSAYSVSEKKLFLRDGSSNIVFECEKAE
jgi:heat shock protein HslJ